MFFTAVVLIALCVANMEGVGIYRSVLALAYIVDVGPGELINYCRVMIRQLGTSLPISWRH